MSEHVVGRVTGTRVCLRCSDLSATGVWECQPNDQCPCCLAAEVERLTAEVNRLSDELGEREAMHFEADAMLVAEQAATKRLTALLEAADAVVAMHDKRIEAALALLLPETPPGRSVPGDTRGIGTRTFPCCQHCPPDGSIHGLHFGPCVECAVAALRGESDE